jgi:hypothetical protein
MNYFLNLAGKALLIYLCLWLVFTIVMGCKLYFDQNGYPSVDMFMKMIYGL